MPGEIADRVKYKQDLVAALDAMTICAFSSYACSTEDYAAALNLVTNASWSAPDLLPAGARIVDVERQYNADCGIGANADVLPERFLREPVPTGPHAGKVCELAPMLQAYYELRGWPAGKLGSDQRTACDTIPAIL